MRAGQSIEARTAPSVRSIATAFNATETRFSLCTL